MSWQKWENWIVKNTEKILNWRKRHKLLKKEKQKRKNQILDWLESLLWAALVVLVVNQYLIQGYAVPTGSMEDTILGEDRLFVDKLVYGPELIPGFAKFPGALPRRGEIVVFVNPKYEEEMGREVSGFEQLFHRLVYMLTFTLVNLDVTKDGRPAHHFLVKRLIGLPGEQLRMRDGRVEIKRAAESDWIKEEDLQKEYQANPYLVFKKHFPYEAYQIVYDNIYFQTLLLGGIRSPELKSGVDREYVKLFLKPYLEAVRGSKLDLNSLPEEKLSFYYKQIVLSAFKKETKNLSTSQIELEYQKLIIRLLQPDYKIANQTEDELKKEFKRTLLRYNLFEREKIESLKEADLDKAFNELAIHYPYLGAFNPDLKTDSYFEDYVRESVKWMLQPYDVLSAGRFATKELGWYIPNTNFFPMGDNRDNSKDARYFDSVDLSALLGRPLLRFWPLPRFGAVRPLP